MYISNSCVACCKIVCLYLCLCLCLCSPTKTWPHTWQWVGVLPATSGTSMCLHNRFSIPDFRNFASALFLGPRYTTGAQVFQKHKKASRWSVFNGSSDFLQINGSIGFNASLYVCFQWSFTKRKPFLLPNWLHWLKHVQDFNLPERESEGKERDWGDSWSDGNIFQWSLDRWPHRKTAHSIVKVDLLSTKRLVCKRVFRSEFVSQYITSKC